MDIAGREDLLLAIFRHLERDEIIPDLPALSAYLKRDEDTISAGITSLAESGDLVFHPDQSYELTIQGRKTAEDILKRHRVLETFFQEMLGMDHSLAHAQACSMEHLATDETIDRLRSFIRGFPPCRGGRGPFACSNTRTLNEVREGECVVIEAIRGCGRAARLADLGIIPGEEIILRQKLAHTFLVQVKGSDIAISHEIALSVIVGETCR